VGCGKVLPYEKRKNKFCDQSCAATHNNKGGKGQENFWKNKYAKQPKQCSRCGDKLPYNHRTNRICDACRLTPKISKKERVKRAKRIKSKKGTCLFCGNNCHKRFCNSACLSKFNWKVLKAEMIRCNQARARGTAKRFLLEQSDKCTICGISEWTGKKILLILDHIDGNAENWCLDNLRLICSNCDSLLPTYKNKNKGNGRHFRRMRYKNGQSY